MEDKFKSGFIKAAMAQGMTEGQAIDFYVWGQKEATQQVKQASAEDLLVEQLKNLIRK